MLLLEKWAAAHQRCGRNIKAPSELDAIDMILEESKEEKPFRLYRGFYWDEDIIRALDSIKKGNRSDLLNLIEEERLTTI